MRQLRSVICHRGSHSFTCYPTQVNTPALTPAMQACTRFTYPGGIEGWVDLVDLIAPQPGVEPVTFRSLVQHPTTATTETTVVNMEGHSTELVSVHGDCHSPLVVYIQSVIYCFATVFVRLLAKWLNVCTCLCNVTQCFCALYWLIANWNQFGSVM